MSWTGEYFGVGGALAEAIQHYKQGEQTPHDRVRLASVYYSAANRALAEVLRGRLRLFGQWARCQTRAVLLVDQAYRMARMSELTLDDIDVMLSVWHRYGNPLSDTVRQRKFALLKEASGRIDRGEPCAAHTFAFLWMHELRTKGERPCKAFVFKIEALAADAANSGRLAQAGRVCKQLAYLLRRSDPKRRQLLQEAAALQIRAGATDQTIKMKAGL